MNARVKNTEAASARRLIASRLVGRVYHYDDVMHFVLSVNEESGFARVSCRFGDKTRVRSIPITEVALRVSAEPPNPNYR